MNQAVWALVLGKLRCTGDLGHGIETGLALAYHVERLARLPGRDIPILQSHCQRVKLVTEANLDGDLICHHFPPFREACSTASMMF